MRLTEDDALARLAAHDHAILCTSHPERGIDAVPVCFAVDRNEVGVPIDTVKAKTSSRLRRERNLDEDPRATCSSSTGILSTGRSCGGYGSACAGSP